MSTFYILLVTGISVLLALVFMSYMTSEAESAGEWFQQSILGRGVPQDERELKKRRAAKMERLLNEKVRVPSSPAAAGSRAKDSPRTKEKDTKDSTTTTTTTTGTAKDTDGDATADKPELRKRTTRADAKKET